MNFVRKKIKNLIFPFLSKWYKRKNGREQIYKANDFELIILPDVFHPGYFLSTKILLNFIRTKELANKRVLELGAGSGFISFYLAKHHSAVVTASDINSNAINGLQMNREKLQIPITVIESDLFENIDLTHFDIVLVNPPYYPKKPSNRKEIAFYCGEDFDYFKRFFSGIQLFASQCAIYMILSEDCQLDQINKLANQHELNMVEVHRERRWGEWNTIYHLLPK